MEKCEPTREELSAKIRTLEERLWEAEQTIEAIQSGEVDALVIHKPEGEQLYTLTGADHGYRVLVESVSEGALILSSDSSIYYCNRTLGEMLQLPIQKIIGRELDSYVASESRAQLMELIKESRSLGAARGEFLMKRNDGTLLPVNVSLNSISLEEFKGVCAVITDLSEQKQVEEELRRHRTELELLVEERTAELVAARNEAIGERNQLEAVMEALPVGMAITDATGGNIRSNAAFEQVWGALRPPTESINDYVAYKAWWPDTGRAVAPEEWASARAVQGGESVVGQLLEIERFDGSRAFAINSASPVRDAQGNVIGSAVAIQDITDLRKAEQALRESEERFRVFMDKSPTAVWIKDDQGHYVYFNKTGENLFGARFVDWLGKSDFEVRPKETAEEFRKNDQAVLAAGHAIEVTEETINPDGSLCHWFISIFPFRDLAGKQYVAGIGLDITERKQAEEELKRTRNTLAESQKIAHLGSFEYVAASRTTAWSEEEYRIYGLDPAGPSPAYDVMLEKCIYPDDAALLHETFAKAMQSHSVYELEHRIVRPDGSVRWVYDRAHPYLDEDGQLLRYVGATLDITERRLMEEELRESRDELEIRVQERTNELAEANRELVVGKGKLSRANELLQTVFDGISEPLLMVERDCRITMLNEAACKYLRIDNREQPIVKTCYELSHGRCGVCSNCAVNEAISDRKRIAFERKGIFDTEHIEEITVYPIAEAPGRAPGAIVRISDITDARNMEKHLIRADRLSSLGVLAGGIAHEIRNPLAGINLFIDVLSDEEKFSRTSQEQDILKEIKINIKKINGIIARVLNFSRQAEPVPLLVLDVSQLVDESLKLWHSRMVKNGIQLSLSLEENLPDIQGDPIEVEQVLINLIQNAIEAMEKGGNLSIEVRKGTISFDTKRRAVIIEVQDSGPGIPLAQQKNIFNPFFTTKPTGTGLGLAISHRIVSRHGGLISFESIPDEGTTFIVELPVAPAG